MDIKDMITLIQAVSDSRLTSFSYEGEDGKLTMEADRVVQAVAVPPQAAVSQVVVQETVATPAASAAKDGEFITSPMVGTFYAAPSEGAAPYVNAGDTVKKGQVIGIVEAMKLMNEIESPFDGVIEEILVENKSMVGFGQELMRVICK